MEWRQTITACVILHNEEALVRRCLESIKSLADEIIVVHDGPCNNETLKIAAEFTDKIFVREHIGHMEPHLAFAYNQASCDWLLRIDADEFFDPETASALKDKISTASEDTACFELDWEMWDGKKQVRSKILRKKCFFRANKFHFIGVIHEVGRVDGATEKIPLLLRHQPLAENVSWSLFLKKIKYQSKFHVRDYFFENRTFECYREDPEVWINRAKKVRSRIIWYLLFEPLKVFLAQLRNGGRLGFYEVSNALMMPAYYFSVYWQVFIGDLKIAFGRAGVLNDTAPETGQAIKLALARADYMTEWEGKLYEDIPGIEVTAFCSLKNPYPTDNIKYPVIKLPASSDNFLIKNYYKYFFGIYRKMFGLEKRLATFDVVYTIEPYNYYTSQAVKAKKNNKKLKVITYVADNTFGRFEYNYWPGFRQAPKYWRKRINKIIKDNIAGVDKFIAVTNYSADLLRSYGVSDDKIEVVSLAIIQSDSKAPESILPSGITKDDDIYLMVNRMTKEKGVYEALYSWLAFKNEIKSSRKKLLIVGDGPERENMMRLAKDLGLQESVYFIKQLPNQQVRQLYKIAKCLILGSQPTPVWQEQFGYVLAEAITNDCPVVSTYSGAIPEVIEDAGLLFSPGQVIELKNCLMKLEDADTYIELKKNCLRVKEKFAIDKFRAEIFRIINGLTK